MYPLKKKQNAKKLNHVKLHMCIILLLLFRYRSEGFITRRARANEKKPIIDDKTEHNNERYVRCEMRYTRFEKNQSDRFLCWY